MSNEHILNIISPYLTRPQLSRIIRISAYKGIYWDYIFKNRKLREKTRAIKMMCFDKMKYIIYYDTHEYTKLFDPSGDILEINIKIRGLINGRVFYFRRYDDNISILAIERYKNDILIESIIFYYGYNINYYTCSSIKKIEYIFRWSLFRHEISTITKFSKKRKRIVLYESKKTKKLRNFA